jgi:hypothetical protein
MRRSVFVGIFLVVLVGMLTVLFRLQMANTDVSTFSISARLTQAEGFLERLYDPSMGLCRETLVGDYLHDVNASNGTSYARLTNETYWVASDNFLDSQALAPYNLTLSENISQTCSRYYNGSYFPYQIINGSNIPLTLHVPNTYVLENTSDHITALNLYNGTVDCSNYLDYPTCGDALVYEALNYYVQGYPLNWYRGLYMRAYGMFDGKGVADAHFQSTSQYDNMKLALLIFGARALNLTVDLTEVEQQLWTAQITNGTEVGGFTSVMLSSGLPNGTANGETTALTLLAYDNNLTGQFKSERDAALPNYSINATFPAATFNQTQFLNTSLIAIPLLDPWYVTLNNTLTWTSLDNPRAGIGLYSSLAYPGNLSIQIIEYDNNHTMDVVIHNATYPNGHRISPAGLNWSNPLTVSLMPGNLNISSPNGTLFTYVFQSFNLTYITGGSTQADIPSGGEIDVRVIPEFSPLLILPLFIVPTLLAVIAHKKRKDTGPT